MSRTELQSLQARLAALGEGIVGARIRCLQSVALATLLLLVCGCGCLSMIVRERRVVPELSAAELSVFQETGLAYSADNPMKVYLYPEIDYTEYARKLRRFGLASVNDRLKRTLAQSEISATGTSTYLVVRNALLANPFRTTQTAQDADLTIQVKVDVFDFGDRRTLGGKIIRFALLGGLGLLGTGEQALMICDYSVTVSSTGDTFRVGTVHSLSGEGMVPRKAYDKVLSRNASNIFGELAALQRYPTATGGGGAEVPASRRSPP